MLPWLLEAPSSLVVATYITSSAVARVALKFRIEKLDSQSSTWPTLYIFVAERERETTNAIVYKYTLVQGLLSF